MPYGQGRGGGQGGPNGRRGGGAGPGGQCVCPNCGHKIAHQPGVPCTSIQCPHCNIAMIRD